MFTVRNWYYRNKEWTSDFDRFETLEDALRHIEMMTSQVLDDLSAYEDRYYDAWLYDEDFGRSQDLAWHICATESADIISTSYSGEEAIYNYRCFEEEDKADGLYSEDFYEITVEVA